MVEEYSVKTPAKYQEYSSQQIEEVSRSSSCFKNYLRLIELKTESFSQMIRQERHKAWVETVLAIYFDTLSAKEVCAFWSMQADLIIQKAWVKAELVEQEDLALFALGKLGCNELNLSSDVDLMILSGKNEIPYKKIQHFQEALNNHTDFGFAFRLDFDLRAGGRLGPLVSTYDQFEDFYGNYGETLDRMSFLRFRPLSGPKELINKCIQFASKFTFRRFIDHNLIDDFISIRPRIHKSKNQSDAHFNLKLHPGGIRDIELFVHALQIIHGGKLPQLQTLGTSETLDQLSAMNLMPQKEAETLSLCYWQLRDLENRVQAKSDQQTHQVNLRADDAFVFSKSSQEELSHIRAEVDRITSTLFGDRAEADSTLPADPEEQKQWLLEKGFRDPAIHDTWDRLMTQKLLSRHQKRDLQAKSQFMNSFVNSLSNTHIDNRLAFQLLEDFLNATRAKSSFLKLFNQEPQLIHSFAFLLSVSPYLGRMLASRPELLDSFFLRKNEPFSNETDILLDQLSEHRLLGELISANDFLADKSVSRLSLQLTEGADSICSALLRKVCEEYAVDDIDLLCLGKWAGQELGFRSDLDFVFVASFEVSANHHKVARRFISYLSSPQKGGTIYSIDMRLRPSGNSGPVIVTLQQLNEYLSQSAAAWERQAYFKSRFLFTRQSLTCTEEFSSSDITELRKIRSQLFSENTPKQKNCIDVKYHAGGLIDIEFAVQVCCIQKQLSPKDASTQSMLDVLAKNSIEWTAAAKVIAKNYDFLRKVEQLYQLCTQKPGSQILFSSDSVIRLARLLESGPQQLKAQLEALLNENKLYLAKLDPVYCQS